MDVWTKARQRLQKYPYLMSQCQEYGTQYSICVLEKSNIKKGDCDLEFQRLKNCLMKAAVGAKTKL